MFKRLAMAPLLRTQYAQHVAREKVARVRLEYLQIEALSFCELSCLMTSGGLIAECLQIHSSHSHCAAQPAAKTATRAFASPVVRSLSQPGAAFNCQAQASPHGRGQK
jgi:hypothetical protein